MKILGQHHDLSGRMPDAEGPALDGEGDGLTARPDGFLVSCIGGDGHGGGDPEYRLATGDGLHMPTMRQQGPPLVWQMQNGILTMLGRVGGRMLAVPAGWRQAAADQAMAAVNGLATTEE